MLEQGLPESTLIIPGARLQTIHTKVIFMELDFSSPVRSRRKIILSFCGKKTLRAQTGNYLQEYNSGANKVDAKQTTISLNIYPG